MKRELDVVAALIKGGDSFLLCQRKADDYYANLWEFPGGSVEEGEEFSFAIEREIKEELGLNIKAHNMLNEFCDENESLKIKVFLFNCSIESGSPAAIECQDFGFFSIKEALKLNLAPVDRKILEYLRAPYF